MTPVPAGHSGAGARPLLVARGLAVDGDHHARLVDPLDLTLNAGEIVALVGENGAGKTTLIRALAGVSKPAAGTLDAGGQPVSGPGHAAYLPQHARPLPWRDATGNAALVLEASGVRRSTARRVARSSLERLELGAVHATRGDRLSGGERQRVLLAGILALDRPVLLLDEPFAALDAIARERAQLLLRRELGAGRGALLVTHDPAEAARVADRIVVLAGRPSTLVAELAPGSPDARSSAARTDLAAEIVALLQSHGADPGGWPGADSGHAAERRR